DLHQAAQETPYRRGIAKPYGEAVRLPGKGKTAAEYCLSSRRLPDGFA
ncbi:hypothetical protein Q6309_27190, partial [Klebsiella pneumoniae]|nr:hypothetical protein [Klebsiella pneumoniae]